jgi:hypothetical protein
MPSSRSEQPSAEERSLRARIAANVRWSREDPREGTTAARRGFIERFRREVDPDGVLTENERERRAHKAMTAHMQRLALASSRARRARKKGRG